MVQSLVNKKPSNQSLRILTASVAIPIIVGIIYLGSPYLDLVAIVALGCLVREWARMSMGNPHYALPYLLSGLLLATLYFDLSLGNYAFYSCVIVALFTFHAMLDPQRLKNFVIHLIGTLYISWSVYILIYLAHEGLELFFLWLLTIIWASDTGAYFAGKNIGGPKLAPTISPNKTWSGFVGGILAATLIGTLTGPYLQDLYTSTPQIIGVCLYLSLMSHLGDLLESLVKRYFNVKDSGTLIPGHGGVLDRLDSMLLVSFAAGLLIVLGI